MKIIDSLGDVRFYGDLPAGATFRYNGDIYIKSEYYGDEGCMCVRLSDGYTREFGKSMCIAEVYCETRVNCIRNDD